MDLVGGVAGGGSGNRRLRLRLCHCCPHTHSGCQPCPRAHANTHTQPQAHTNVAKQQRRLEGGLHTYTRTHNEHLAHTRRHRVARNATVEVEAAALDADAAYTHTHTMGAHGPHRQWPASPHRCGWHVRAWRRYNLHTYTCTHVAWRCGPRRARLTSSKTSRLRATGGGRRWRAGAGGAIADRRVGSGDANDAAYMAAMRGTHTYTQSGRSEQWRAYEIMRPLTGRKGTATG